MGTESLQYIITGTSAATVARSIERGVVLGQLGPGDPLPSVRSLAGTLGLSPSTVASAYRELRQRGVLVSHDRSRTVVAHRPPLVRRLGPELPPDTTDLATGNPDPDLLPDLATPLANVGPVHRLYGDEPAVHDLLELAGEGFRRDGIDARHLAVVAGGLDGIERVLEIHCRTGDRIAVEDPGYIGTLDLIRTVGLVPVPLAVDDQGPRVDALTAALEQGVTALLTVPRAQNPTGAALSTERATQLREVLDGHPEVVVIEDDHASLISGEPYQGLCQGRGRWAVVRSVAKSLGPDLRVAVLAADSDTATRLVGRQRLGTGWVSHLLQRLTASAWSDALADGTLARATATYAQRRRAAIAALADVDILAYGRSGFNLWIDVDEEVPVVQGLLARGWAVQAGEPFRLESDPGIRVTVATLGVDRAGHFAQDLALVLDQHLGTRRG